MNKFIVGIPFVVVGDIATRYLHPAYKLNNVTHSGNAKAKVQFHVQVICTEVQICVAYIRYASIPLLTFVENRSIVKLIFLL